MDVIQDKEIGKPDTENKGLAKYTILKNEDKQQYNSPTDSELLVFYETPEKAAKSLLVELSDILHLSVDQIDLRLMHKKSTPTGSLIKFQQYKKGIPIEGAEITVQSDKNGLIRSISAQCIQGF